MNVSESELEGWSSSYMRNSLLNSSFKISSGNTLMASLPPDLRSVMKPANKYTYNTTDDGSSDVTPTTDYLWLLAEFEIFGERHYANTTEQSYQEQYAYFRSGNDKIAYKHGETETPCMVWLRSSWSALSDWFCYVTTKGSFSYSTADAPHAILACFGV